LTLWDEEAFKYRLHNMLNPLSVSNPIGFEGLNNPKIKYIEWRLRV